MSMVARVIFSEASSICAESERFFVASVIKNRVGHIGFGKKKTMEDVVTMPRQFSCIGDLGNQNWNNSGKYDESGFVPDADKSAWNNAVLLSQGLFEPCKGIVYYHDKSIRKPRSWDNKYWKAVSAFETKHFIFYKVIEKSK